MLLPHSELYKLFRDKNSIIDILRQNPKKALLRSKKASEELTRCNRSAGTRYHAAYWTETWEVFLTEVLKKDLAQQPTGEDLKCFFLEIPHHMKQQSNDRTKIAHSTLNGALSAVIKAIRLRHNGFRLTLQEESRLRDVFQTLIDQGKIKMSRTYQPNYCDDEN